MAQRLIDAGLYERAGVPLKKLSKADGEQYDLRTDLLKLMRVMDEQEAVQRYRWYNLPLDLSSADLERLLYYKGQLCFFYFEQLDKFFFMPYALDGTIDFYQRFNRVRPIPMSAGGEESKDGKEIVDAQTVLLSKKQLNVIYGINDFENPVDPYESCVLLQDYTPQRSQTIICRQELQDAILSLEANMLPYLNTTLMVGTGVQALRINSQDESSNVLAAGKSINKAALTGTPYIPITGNLEFQEIGKGARTQASDYLQSMQAIDNLRLAFLGLDSGGIFQKKTQMLEAEQSMNADNVHGVLENGLAIRQRFCDIANSVFGTQMYVEIADSATGVDSDLDGKNADNEDQSGFEEGSQPVNTSNDEM